MVQLKKSTREATPDDPDKVEYAFLDVTKLVPKASPPETPNKNSEPEGNVLATLYSDYIIQITSLSIVYYCYCIVSNPGPYILCSP